MGEWVEVELMGYKECDRRSIQARIRTQEIEERDPKRSLSPPLFRDIGARGRAHPVPLRITVKLYIFARLVSSPPFPAALLILLSLSWRENFNATGLTLLLFISVLCAKFNAKFLKPRFLDYDKEIEMWIARRHLQTLLNLRTGSENGDERFTAVVKNLFLCGARFMSTVIPIYSTTRLWEKLDYSQKNPEDDQINWTQICALRKHFSKTLIAPQTQLQLLPAKLYPPQLKRKSLRTPSRFLTKVESVQYLEQPSSESDMLADLKWAIRPTLR
jgi:hypothetical protein